MKHDFSKSVLLSRWVLLCQAIIGRNGTAYEASRAVTFSLSLNKECLYRIDWRPSHNHNNHGKGLECLRHFEFEGCHVHMFNMNFLPAEDRLYAGNLPVAVPISFSPKGFEELLVEVKFYMNIENIEMIRRPEFQDTLF